MIKNQLVTLQQESQIICTKDEVSKRHTREVQEHKQRDEKPNRAGNRKMEVEIKIQVRSK